MKGGRGGAFRGPSPTTTLHFPIFLSNPVRHSLHRCEAFLKARPALEKEHGAEYVQEQTDFYAAVTKVYHRIEDGNRLER